jgi:hypothetical protein
MESADTPVAQADHARDVFDDVIAERDALQQQVATLRDACCGTCGRACAPDGDCYGCAYDQAVEQVATLTEALSIEKLQRLYSLVANLAHPRGDHRENPLEDEAHDLIREIRAALAAVRGER